MVAPVCVCVCVCVCVFEERTAHAFDLLVLARLSVGRQRLLQSTQLTVDAYTYEEKVKVRGAASESKLVPY